MKLDVSGSRLEKRSKIVIIIVLFFGTIVCYRPALNNGFLSFDDYEYITQNAHVTDGFTLDSLIWAFRGPDNANWHPLTSLSNIFACQIFGLNPWGHHLINIVFHSANAVLAFLLFQRLTRQVWFSAFFAAVFAVHPLRVESVAWISERKDVLSAFFGFLTLMFYLKFNDYKGSDGEQTHRKLKYYIATLLLFALSLMSKPMLVTLPFVMVLLDYWPLQRVNRGNYSRWFKLIVEKWPFCLMSVLSSVITFVIQKKSGAMGENLGIYARISNAIVSYVRYLWMTFWPVDLSAYYPHPKTWSAVDVCASATLIIAITFLAYRFSRNHGYLLTGWFWFLGMLVPVIGLVQVGSQSIADRYMYFPQIGILLAVCCLLQKLVTTRLSVFVTASCVILALVLLTIRQISYWKDVETLFRHAILVTKENAFAQCALGDALVRSGKREEGLYHLHEAMRIDANGRVYGFFGFWAAEHGDYDQAIIYYEQAVRLDPNLHEVCNNLSWILSAHPDPTIRNGKRAVELSEMACAITHNEKTLYLGTLAAAYAECGRFDDAVKTAMLARDHAQKWGEKELAKKNEELLELYRAGKPYHDTNMISN